MYSSAQSTYCRQIYCQCAFEQHVDCLSVIGKIVPRAILRHLTLKFFLQSSKSEKYITYDTPDTPSANTQSDKIQADEEKDEVDVDVQRLTKIYTTEPAVNNLSFRAHRGEVGFSFFHLRNVLKNCFSDITENLYVISVSKCCL